jgi:hypothetical protein
MSGPRTKRQFAGAASDPSQRQITSFFAKTSSTTTSASLDAARKSSSQAALNGPVLPAQVQTDLLNVGMRVRKAIPEGYKTGSTYSAFTLWSEDSTSNLGDSRPASAAPTATYSSTMRELEPFCGINKVGGLAFQPSYHHNDTTPDDDDLDAMPGLTSSQDTIASTASTASSTTVYLNVTTPVPSAPNRKRFFTSEEDEAAHGALSTSLPYRGPFRLSSDSQEAWLEEEISPRSLAPPPGMWENARVLAVPRRTKQGRKMESAGAMGQENVMVMVRGQDGNDFEEASFLDYGLRGDGRMEVE